MKEAGKLIDEIEGRFKLKSEDRNKLFVCLSDITMPESSRFYEEIPADWRSQVTITDSSTLYHDLTLRKVLRNENAGQYRASGLKKLAGKILSCLGVYSSTDYTRDLRYNDNIVYALSRSSGRYSLLGKLETFDISNPEESLVIIKPVLFVPGVRREDEKLICGWQDKNIRAFIEKGKLFPRRKRVKLETV